jgi:hypothetical protein
MPACVSVPEKQLQAHFLQRVRLLTSQNFCSRSPTRCRNSQLEWHKKLVSKHPEGQEGLPKALGNI